VPRIQLDYAKGKRRGRLLEVQASPRTVPEVVHLVDGGDDRYLIDWSGGGSAPSLVLHVRRDVMQAIIAAALVAPAISIEQEAQA